MRLVYRFFIIFITLSIAMGAIFLAENIILRFPDIYTYEFNKTQILAEIDLVYEEQDLAKLFSDYLMNITGEFQIVAEYKGRELEVFSNSDQISMERLKWNLNLHLVIAVAGIILSTGIIYFMIQKGIKKAIRRAYNYALTLFGTFWVAMCISYLTGWYVILVDNLLYLSGGEGEKVLSSLIGIDFMRDWLIFTFIASSIIIFIIRGIIWKFTKERRMFLA